MGNYSEGLVKTANVLKTIAHPTRLMIIHLLHIQGRMSVNSLSKATNCEQSLLSHHLSNMKNIGLLKAEREGQKIFYSLCGTEISNMLQNVEFGNSLNARNELPLTTSPAIF